MWLTCSQPSGYPFKAVLRTTRLCGALMQFQVPRLGVLVRSFNVVYFVVLCSVQVMTLYSGPRPTQLRSFRERFNSSCYVGKACSPKFSDCRSQAHFFTLFFLIATVKCLYALIALIDNSIIFSEIGSILYIVLNVTHLTPADGL